MAFTVQPLLDPNSLRPQLTVVSVWPSTVLIAEVVWSHFEHPGVLQFWPVAGSRCIEPDRSSTIRMSGGSFDDGMSTSPHSVPPPLFPAPVWLPVPVLVPPKLLRPVVLPLPPAPELPFPAGVKLHPPQPPTIKATHKIPFRTMTAGRM